jgi:glycosyltransferase involved in cell wall biosynthesis
MPPLPSYVIVTPARNEAQFIKATIQSMVAQTVKPLRWVIVSDGSTDGTDDIVQRYVAEHPWMELLRMPERHERHFSGKVYAFEAGYGRLAGLDYDIVGNLDADISFGPGHMAFLLEKFAENPLLGVGGTPYEVEGTAAYDYRFASIHHVAGACQLFRRECFEEIGGYVAVRGGSIDYIAVSAARMKGWQTRSFTEQKFTHLRETGTAEKGVLSARFRNGVKDYAIGNHPLWELCRAAFQMTKRPFLLGGLAVLTGYFWSTIRRLERPVKPDMVAFERREQMRRLRNLLLRKWTNRDALKDSPGVSC